MLIKQFESKFKNDLKRCIKRKYDLTEFDNVIEVLIKKKPLLPKHRNHKLHGEYHGKWECHVHNDLLLIYHLTNTHLILSRLGTHSDLFK